MAADESGERIRESAVTSALAARRNRWRLSFAALWLILSVSLLAHPGVRYLASNNHDWQAWHAVRPLIEAGNLYARDAWFVWSPIAMWLLAYVFVPLGYSWFVAVKLALLPLIRDWWLIGLTVVSVPFWVDILIGNTITFVFVAGVLALQGSRAGAFASIALFVLMPRPLSAPLVAWLLWKESSWRWLFVTLTALTLGVALATGYLDDWLANMLAIGTGNTGHFANLSPTKLIGSAWLLAGVPLAGWLTVKGRVGLAGLAMSPYVLPMYPIVLLWEWVIECARRSPGGSRGGR